MKTLREKMARAIHPDAFGTLGAIRPDSIAIANEAADAKRARKAAKRLALLRAEGE